MKEEKIQYYEGVYADEFPIGPYFRDQFNTIPSNLRYDYSFKYVELLEYLLHTYSDKLILKRNLNFQDYHREFLDCYGIIPLISNQENACYYKNKLTGGKIND